MKFPLISGDSTLIIWYNIMVFLGKKIELQCMCMVEYTLHMDFTFYWKDKSFSTVENHISGYDIIQNRLRGSFLCALTSLKYSYLNWNQWATFVKVSRLRIAIKFYFFQTFASNFWKIVLSQKQHNDIDNVTEEKIKTRITLITYLESL